MGLPRVAPAGGIRLDDEGGPFFPGGTVLSVNPYVLHTSKALWGEDASEFRPERWLGPDAARLEKMFCPVSWLVGYTDRPLACTKRLACVWGWKVKLTD